jgi:hypothetical protein
MGVLSYGYIGLYDFRNFFESVIISKYKALDLC